MKETVNSYQKWDNKPLGEVVTLQRGFDLPIDKRKPGKIPIISSSGITDYQSEVGAEGPGVITGRYGTIGRVFFIKDEYWPLNTTLFVKDFHGNDPRFIFYLLHTIDYASCSDKSSVPGVNRNDLHRIFVKIPPLPTQRAIAHILGNLDDKIELNRKMNETLEAMAQAIFKSWFVDFDPVRAKMEGVEPPGMDAETAALFPSEFEMMEGQEVPKGWKIRNLGELCEVGRGSSPRPINDYMNGEIPWIKIADATKSAGPYVFETSEYLKTEGLKNTVPVIPGDLILSNSATCGVPIFVDLHGCIHDGWLHFKNLKFFSKIYLYHLLKTISNHLIHIADGSVQKNLNTQLIRSQIVLVPDEKIITVFDSIVSPIFDKILINGRESLKLSKIRDVLLPKLMSGELDLTVEECV